MRLVRASTAVWLTIVSALATALVVGEIDKTAPPVSYAVNATESGASTVEPWEVSRDCRKEPKIYRLEGEQGANQL